MGGHFGDGEGSGFEIGRFFLAGVFLAGDFLAGDFFGEAFGEAFGEGLLAASAVVTWTEVADEQIMTTAQIALNTFLREIKISPNEKF